MADASLKFNVVARDNASSTLERVGKHLGGIGKIAAGISAAGVFDKVAGAVTDFAKESIDKFSEVGAETARMQRLMGGSAEDASRLAASFKVTGVDIDAGAKAMGKFSQFMVKAGTDQAKYTIGQQDAAAKHKAFTGQLGGSASALARFGLSATDASGKLKSSKQFLGEVAEQFKSMPNGAQKTALAMQIFGKAGAGMIPFLNKGKEGIKDLAKESDKLGTTLSGKDLAATKEAAKAKRVFGEAMAGVQMTIGRNLLPILTKFALFMVNNVMPALKTGTDAVMKFLAPAFKWVSDMITKTVIPTVMTLARQFATNIWPVIQRVAGIVMQNLMPAFKALADYWMKVVIPQLIRLWPTIQTVGKWLGILAGIVLVVASYLIGKFYPIVAAIMSKVLPALVTAIIWVVGAFNKFITGIVSVAQKVPGAWAAVTSFFSGLPAKFRQMGSDMLAGLWNGIKSAFSTMMGNFKALINLLPDAVKKILGIASPSKVFHALGMEISRGLMNGINSGKQSAVDTVGRMADAVLTRAKKALDDLKKQRTNYAGSIRDNVLQGAGLGGIQADPNTGRLNITAGLQMQAAKFRNFGNALKRLKAMGLNAALYAQIVNLGPDQGMDAAQALIAGGKSGITSANSAWNSVASSAQALGNQVAGDKFAGQIAAAVAKVKLTTKLVNQVHVYLDGVHIASTKAHHASGKHSHHVASHKSGSHTTVHVHVSEPVDPAATARRIGAILDKGISSGAYKPSRLVTK